MSCAPETPRSKFSTWASRASRLRPCLGLKMYFLRESGYTHFSRAREQRRQVGFSREHLRCLALQLMQESGMLIGAEGGSMPLAGSGLGIAEERGHTSQDSEQDMGGGVSL